MTANDDVDTRLGTEEIAFTHFELRQDLVELLYGDMISVEQIRKRWTYGLVDVFDNFGNCESLYPIDMFTLPQGLLVVCIIKHYLHDCCNPCSRLEWSHAGPVVQVTAEGGVELADIRRAEGVRAVGENVFTDSAVM